MAFHIPFNQRNRRPPVVYIGFETPRRRRNFNWWAFHGFWMTAASIAATFATQSPIPLFGCPLALLVSLRGLKKRPRRLATVSTLMGVAGTAVLGIGLFGLVSEKAAQKHLRALQINRAREHQMIESSKKTIESAVHELNQFKEDNGTLPGWVDGNMLMLKHKDSWGNSIRFDAEESQSIVRSAGPDEEFDTQDDLTETVVGQSDLTVRL